MKKTRRRAEGVVYLYVFAMWPTDTEVHFPAVVIFTLFLLRFIFSYTICSGRKLSRGRCDRQNRGIEYWKIKKCLIENAYGIHFHSVVKSNLCRASGRRTLN